MRNKTFPKEGRQKDKQTIKDLRDRLRDAEKARDFYKNEIDNLQKPVRPRKGHVDKPALGSDEWQADFMRRFKKEVLGEP